MSELFHEDDQTVVFKDALTVGALMGVLIQLDPKMSVNNTVVNLDETPLVNYPLIVVGLGVDEETNEFTILTFPGTMEQWQYNGNQ